MLPTLEARESITAANRHAMGSGALSPEASRDIGRSWQNAAGYQRPVRKATPAQLAAIGVRVVRVTAPGKGA